MFESLDDAIQRDERTTSTRTQRWLRYGTVLLASVLLFGALGAVIWMFE